MTSELLSRVTRGFDSQTASRDSEIIDELLSPVTRGFESPNSPLGLINDQRTAVTGDAWIRQPRQPLGTKQSSMNFCHR